MGARGGYDIDYVGFVTGQGGDANQMALLADGAKRRGMNVRITVPEADTTVGFAERARASGIDCVRSPLLRADESGPKQAPGSMIRLARSLTSPIIHLHTGNSCPPRSVMLALLVTRAPPAFVTVHSPYETISASSSRAHSWAWLARRKVVAVVSPSDHGSAFQAACGIGSEQVVTIRNAIDTAAMAGGDGRRIRRELGVGDDAPLLVFTSRLEPQKRPVDAVKMFAAVSAEFPDAALVFVGTGTQHDAIAAEATASGVGDRVQLVGHRPDVADWLAAATVWLLPTERENFSVAVLEALAAGCPVLTTHCAGNDEIIRHDDNALAVDVGDLDAGADALRRLLLDADLRRRLGRRANECAQDYTVDRMVDRYCALYDRVRVTTGNEAK